MAKEMVHHPDHYQGKGGLEVWQVQEAFTADLKGVIAGDACALIKYACRWPKKNGVEDLKKIIEYANHLIEKLEEDQHATDVWKDATIHRMTAIVDDIQFPSEKSAEDALHQLKEVLDTYGVVRVLDLLDLLDLRTPYDQGVSNYGWINLDDAYVDHWQSEEDRNLSCWVVRMPRIIALTLKEKESN